MESLQLKNNTNTGHRVWKTIGHRWSNFINALNSFYANSFTVHFICTFKIFRKKGVVPTVIMNTHDFKYFIDSTRIDAFMKRTFSVPYRILPYRCAKKYSVRQKYDSAWYAKKFGWWKFTLNTKINYQLMHGFWRKIFALPIELLCVLVRFQHSWLEIQKPGNCKIPGLMNSF